MLESNPLGSTMFEDPVIITIASHIIITIVTITIIITISITITVIITMTTISITIITMLEGGREVAL